MYIFLLAIWAEGVDNQVLARHSLRHTNNGHKKFFRGCNYPSIIVIILHKRKNIQVYLHVQGAIAIVRQLAKCLYLLEMVILLLIKVPSEMYGFNNYFAVFHV